MEMMMYVLDKLIHAFGALVFHITLSVSMLVVGDWPVQAFALVALFTAGLSQFFVQDDTPHFTLAAIVSAYLSMLSLFLGIILFMFPV